MDFERKRRIGARHSARYRDAWRSEMKTRAAVMMVMVVSILGTRVGAHHGAAAYDMAETRTLEATIVEFRWINPHALIEFDAAAEEGSIRRWTAETAGLTILLRAGWTKSTLARGMHVTIAGHPAHNDSATMILDRVILPDGRVMSNFVPR
jgi:hypothetical protein